MSKNSRLYVRDEAVGDPLSSPLEPMTATVDADVSPFSLGKATKKVGFAEEMSQESETHTDKEDT